MRLIFDRTPAALLIALAVSLTPAPAQQDFDSVQIKATKVAGSVYMLEGSGGNIGVSVGEDGLLIVDDQFAPLADKIRAALKGLGDGKLKFVLNTHWHGDHTGGNRVFGREAPIIAHANVRRRLMTDQNIRGRVVEASPKEALPVITFNAALSVHFNGEEIRAIHSPRAHTDGDTVVHFTGSNVVHMGDLFFSGRFPFVDLGSGGDVENLLRTVEGILAGLPEGVKIIPGHGPLSSAEDLKTYAQMLRESIAFVKSGLAEDRSLEDLVEKGLSERWKDWAWGFISEADWIGLIHASLTREGGGEE